ncbi:MAG: hypothetical protein GX858_04465 [Clostridiales bacterium]|nr:hypothetical protein [Clostridiales bacterium]
MMILITLRCLPASSPSYQAAQGAKRFRIKYFEGSTVDETHISSINNTLLAGGRLYRRYSVCKKAL